ncbi:PilW family protein [Patescibacteria group bacterium]
MRKNGFTLVEILIYIAILAVVSVVIVNSLLVMMKSFHGYRIARFVNVNGAMAIERVVREIRFAGDIGEESILDVSPGKLVFGDLEIFVSNSELMLKDGDADAVSLTSDKVQVENLVFKEIETINSKAVKIEVEFKSSRGTYQKTAKFYDTVVLRGSYGE